MTDLPDKSWYTSESKKHKLSHHCPIASITGCPRFFASLDHAQQAKILHGQISSEVRYHLLAQWKSEDALLIDDLNVGTYWTPKGILSGASNFCPEVMGRLNGLYCSDYKVNSDNTQSYTYIHGKHYSECLEYSTLGYEEKDLTPIDRGVTAAKRFAVLKRDKYKCVYCGRSASDVELHIDHKISRADGGGDEVTNLVAACSLCNNGKGSGSAI